MKLVSGRETMESMSSLASAMKSLKLLADADNTEIIRVAKEAGFSVSETDKVSGDVEALREFALKILE